MEYFITLWGLSLCGFGAINASVSMFIVGAFIVKLGTSIKPKIKTKNNE